MGRKIFLDIKYHWFRVYVTILILDEIFSDFRRSVCSLKVVYFRTLNRFHTVKTVQIALP